MKGGQAMIGFLAGLKRLYNLRDLERRLLLARVPVNGICVEIGVDRGLHADVSWISVSPTSSFSWTLGKDGASTL